MMFLSFFAKKQRFNLLIFSSLGSSIVYRGSISFFAKKEKKEKKSNTKEKKEKNVLCSFLSLLLELLYVLCSLSFVLCSLFFEH